MLLLTTIWVLLVMPVENAALPSPKQFEFQAVEFDSLQDCDDFGRTRLDEITEATYADHHAASWQRRSREKRAPAEATATYSCVERNR